MSTQPVYADCTEHSGCPIHGPDCPLHNLCQVDTVTGEHFGATRLEGQRALQTLADLGSHDHPPLERRGLLLGAALGGGVVAAVDLLLRLL